MSVTISISEEVARQLRDLSFEQADDLEQKVQSLVKAEHRRRLARYQLTDQRLSQKYGMAFEEFERRQVTRQREYAWDVESDAIAWETAIDGIQTMQEQMASLDAVQDED